MSIATENTQLTIRQRLESNAFRDSIASTLPKHLSPDRMIRLAITAITRTPKLQQCTQQSFFDCMMKLTQWGLEADGRRAHLIPFENRKKKIVECQLIIDYKGVAELVMRSGLVSNIHADIVCQNDEFEYDRGQVKRHRIDFKSERGAVYAIYSIVRMKDGGEKCDVMSVAEVNRVRDASQGFQAFKKGYTPTNPWQDHWDEMAKKTVFKRLSKWIPWSAEIREVIEYGDDPIDTTAVEHKECKRIGGLDDLADIIAGKGQDSQGSDNTSGDEPNNSENPNSSAEPGGWAAEFAISKTLVDLTGVYARYEAADKELSNDPDFNACYEDHKRRIKASEAKGGAK